MTFHFPFRGIPFLTIFAGAQPQAPGAACSSAQWDKMPGPVTLHPDPLVANRVALAPGLTGFNPDADWKVVTAR